MGLLSSIRKFDAYTKPVEDFRERTVTGAVITIICTILCLILFISELGSKKILKIFYQQGKNLGINGAL